MGEVGVYGWQDRDRRWDGADYGEEVDSGLKGAREYASPVYVSPGSVQHG